MSTQCRPCISLDCSFPSDLELYSMDGLNFFLGGQLFTVFECPPEYDCDTRPLPWNLRITCCGQTIVGNVPGGASLAQINTVWQAMLAYCASLSCGGGPGPSPSSNGWQISLRVCNTTLIGNVPPGATPAQINNIWLALQHQYALLLPTCNGVTPSNPVPPPSKPQFVFKGSFPTVVCLDVLMPSDTVSVITGFSSVVFVVSSGTLPPGTTLVQIGPKSAAIHGTPTVPGTYTFTVQVNNGTWSSQKSYTIAVFGITNPTLPDGTVGTAYSEQLLTSGGTAPINFYTDPIDLPDGLTMDASGLITGTPTVEDIFTFGVTIMDANGEVCAQDATINVIAAAACVDWTTLDWGTPIPASVVNGSFTPLIGQSDSFAASANAGVSQVFNTASFSYKGPGCNCNLEVTVLGGTFPMPTCAIGIDQLPTHIPVILCASNMLAPGVYNFPFSLPDTGGLTFNYQVLVHPDDLSGPWSFTAQFSNVP